MSAVSKKLIPASRAASTTRAVASRSMRHPKLLHPSPTNETSSAPILRFSKHSPSLSDARMRSRDLAQCYPDVLTLSVSPRTALLYLAATLAAAQTAEPPPPVLLDAMSQELNRNFKAMKEKADPPPYFISYEVTEIQYHSISA